MRTFCVCFIFAAVIVTADDLNLNKWTCNATANFYQVSRTQHLNITNYTRPQCGSVNKIALKCSRRNLS